MFEQHPEPDGLTEDETGEIDIVLSWVDANKDFVNYINIDVTGNQAACLKLIKDYIGDDELLQKEAVSVEVKSSEKRKRSRKAHSQAGAWERRAKEYLNALLFVPPLRGLITSYNSFPPLTQWTLF